MRTTEKLKRIIKKIGYDPREKVAYIKADITKEETKYLISIWNRVFKKKNKQIK